MCAKDCNRKRATTDDGILNSITIKVIVEEGGQVGGRAESDMSGAELNISIGDPGLHENSLLYPKFMTAEGSNMFEFHMSGGLSDLAGKVVTVSSSLGGAYNDRNFV